jgi:xanthine/uracil/vitamin C permease (AzgA family)
LVSTVELISDCAPSSDVGKGTGRISYQDALGAVFLEGWIFMILALLGVRQWLARAIPRSLVLSIGAGIGKFQNTVFPSLLTTSTQAYSSPLSG